LTGECGFLLGARGKYLFSAELSNIRAGNFEPLARNKELFMKQTVWGLTLAASAAAMIWGTPALAQEELFKKNACFACHAIDRKLVGPAYKDVAEKYRGQNDAPDKLYQKVRKGGQGVWGQIPMPPNPIVPETDLKVMIKYILSL
jgi:cytochrome c